MDKSFFWQNERCSSMVFMNPAHMDISFCWKNECCSNKDGLNQQNVVSGMWFPGGDSGQQLFIQRPLLTPLASRQ
jgi:hypothetical protein